MFIVLFCASFKTCWTFSCELCTLKNLRTRFAKSILILLVSHAQNTFNKGVNDMENLGICGNAINNFQQKVGELPFSKVTQDAL